MPKSSRQLLSAMELHLRETVQPARRLLEMEWRDFRALDHPETADAVTLATEAFLYLSVDGDGGWTGAIHVLAAIKAFLDGETARESHTADVARLAVILKKTPVPVAEVRHWFDSVYR